MLSDIYSSILAMTMAEKILFTYISTEQAPDSEVLINAEIPVETALSQRARALARLNGNINLPGFRRGHIPEDMLIKTVGEHAVYEEAATLALHEAYPSLLETHAKNALGNPDITITKLTPGDPVVFSVRVALWPEVTLPEYAAIAQKIMAQEDDLSVREEEIEEALKELQTNVARAKRTATVETAQESLPTIAPEDLPAVTDEFVAKFGNFTTVADFKKTIGEQLAEEKKKGAGEKKRLQIAEELVASLKDVPLPKLLVENELRKMMAQLESDLERSGIPLKDCLTHIKKTTDELRDEWKSEGEKRSRLRLALDAIALREHIEAAKEDVEKEVEAIVKLRKDVPREHIQEYVETMLRNEAVFEFLEKQ